MNLMTPPLQPPCRHPNPPILKPINWSTFTASCGTTNAPVMANQKWGPEGFHEIADFLIRKLELGIHSAADPDRAHQYQDARQVLSGS